jgi:hypothetical protein
MCFFRGPHRKKNSYALGRSIVYNQVLAEIGLRIKGSFVEFETETETKGN